MIFVGSYKLKCDACEKGSSKQRKLMNIAVNYLCVPYLLPLSALADEDCRYRYGTLIVFANYLIEMKERKNEEITFPEWLHERREITKLLGRRSLD